MDVSRGMVMARLSFLAVAIALATRAIAAPITLESAQMGVPDQGIAPIISAKEFVGWRFRITAPTAVTHVGGHLGSISGELFAAILPLPSSDTLPQGAPFAADSVIAKTTFKPPGPTADVRVPLSVTLAPGAYALVFGSGQFGAAGTGVIANTGQPNIAPTVKANYIRWQEVVTNVFQWTNGSLDNMRFVVVGQATAGPADFNHDGSINGLDLAIWKVGVTGGVPASSTTGDANGDGRVDGLDFLVWQRSVTPPATTGAVPEPTAMSLLQAAAAAVGLFGCRRRARG